MNNEGLLWLFNETLSFKKIPPAINLEAFGKALLVCANGDGKIDDAERAWVVGALSAYGAPESVIAQVKTYQGNDDLAKLIESTPTLKMSAHAALYDAIRACAADGDIAQGEIKALEKLASSVGVKPEKVGQLVELYHEEQKLKQKRLSMMFPNGIPFQN